MKTYTAKASEIKKNWLLIDAEGLVLGRLASIVAMRLRGKHKVTFTPNLDCGDHIIVINAEKVKLTGKKLADKTYYRHTGYPGGIKSATAGKVLESAYPERVISKAVERMLPKGPLGRKIMSNLRVYGGAQHPHAAQQPQSVDVASMNSKNARSA